VGWNGPKFTMYGKTAIQDERKCSACTCGTPAGGACIGRFIAYSDSSCQVEVAQHYPIKSTGPACIDFMPIGPGLGSKVITDLDYVPGTCAATGGEPEGEAVLSA
jgi:hypothetical protein